MATSPQLRSPAEPGAEANAFERARRQRIEENRAAMEAMGLVSSSAQLRQSRQLRRPKQVAQPSCKKPTTQPTRQSARLRDVAPTIQPLGQEWRMRPAPRLRKPEAPMTEEQQADYAADLRSHNKHRLMTMSEQALQTRINRITNIDKMRSFAKVLEGSGKTRLAEEARQALQRLLSNLE